MGSISENMCVLVYPKFMPYKILAEMDGDNDTVDSTKTEEPNTSTAHSLEQSLNGHLLNSQMQSVEATDSITNDTDETPTTEETCSSDSLNLNALKSENSSFKFLDHETLENTISNCDLSNDVEVLREQNKTLQANIVKLEKDIAKLEADRSAELHALQLETLEKTILQQKHEIKRLQESGKQQVEVLHKQMGQLKQEYDSKLERLSRQYDVANKERESMVMKYAVSEKSVIDLKREIQSYENKMKESLKDKESSQAKLKLIVAEKTKLNQLLEAKNSEITALERENSKRKDEIHIRDSKVKWAQNRLKAEMENHAETQGKLEKLQQKFNEAKEEAEQYKKQSQALIKSYQEAQEDKANQVQEQKAKLIIDKHDEETAAKLQLELENHKKRQQSLMEENNHLNAKIQNLEKKRVEYEQNLSKMKQQLDSEKQLVVSLQSQLTELESTSVLLQNEQERLAACQSEIERLHSTNTELQQEMESCRSREAELLEFTQKLTEKNVRLQSEFTSVEARAQQLEIEHSACKRQISQLTSENSTLREELERERKQRASEKELLSNYIAEQTQKTEALAQELADQQGENHLLKKKHLVSLKELTKELQMCRKKLEIYENSQGLQVVDGSRTSSNISLNTVENNENKTSSSQPSPTSQSSIPTEPDRQLLIDKIVKIQRSNARKTEKIEFLEEHVSQLVSELQKKTRIIQNYIIREQSGALSSEKMDHNKVALSKHGGIMASVYNSKAVDEGMTLELSLEINQKLQAVLEDTILKNITLKENMETLGNEIARLTSCQKPRISS